MLRNLVVAALFVLAFVQPANADRISFTFGISSDITVPANQRVDLPAVLINTGTDPIAFGCALVPCGGLDFGVGMTAGPGETLGPLDVQFPGFYQQFENVTIPVGQTFPFVFASIQFDPSSTTVLHPIVSFEMREVAERLSAHIPVMIRVGPELEFGPPSFVPASPVGLEPIPEPATFVMLVSVGAAAGLSRVRRRLMRKEIR